MTTTLTGPESFRASFAASRSARSSGYSLRDSQPAEPAATFAGAEEIPLFEDEARKRGYRPYRSSPNGGWAPGTPGFRRPTISKLEKTWLGREVAFRYYLNHPYDTEVRSVKELVGHVVSTAPSPNSLWVFVPSEGLFFKVRAREITPAHFAE